MKITLDYKDSKKQLAPDGEYSLRMKKQQMKNAKESGNQMDELQWELFNPPSGVTMEQIEKVIIFENLVFVSNALFKVKQVFGACQIPIECEDCHTEYQAATEEGVLVEECPNCGGTLFTFDTLRLEGATCGGYVKTEIYRDRPKNIVERYFTLNK